MSDHKFKLLSDADLKALIVAPKGFKSDKERALDEYVKRMNAELLKKYAKKGKVLMTQEEANLAAGLQASGDRRVGQPGFCAGDTLGSAY
jgi:hypothetical protein